MPTPTTAHPPVHLPERLQPPLELALARAAEAIPAPRAMAVGAQYEPKWDGFRLAIIRDPNRTTLWSRHGNDLTDHFPDLAAAAERQIPAGCTVDGEAVVWSGGRLDFDSLQRRLVTHGPALERLARRHPAVLVGFDLLAAAGHDLRPQPLSTRRALLEELATGWNGPLQLSPATTDAATAEEWFAALPATGIEGLVVKGLTDPYRGGHRGWVKVKHRDTIEVIAAAITGTRTRPEQLVIAQPTDGTLHVSGWSSRLPAAAARTLSTFLRPPTGPHPWAASLPTGAAGRYGNRSRQSPVTLIEPIVIEVSADIARTGDTFRHPVRYVRVRPELAPTDLPALPAAS